VKATTKDLRLKTRELIAATDRGEEVLITFRGQPRARLVPLSDAHHEKARQGRNPAFGLWSDQDGSVAEQVDRLRQARNLD